MNNEVLHVCKPLCCNGLTSGGGAESAFVNYMTYFDLLKKICKNFLLILALSIVFPAFAQDVPLPEEEKIYTLVLIEDADPNNLPENAVTKYEFNKETGKLEPQYYELKLTKTEFGTGGGVEYFKWQKDTNGNQTLVGADKESAQITAQYDNSKTYQRITNTTDLSVIDKGSFISQGGSDVTSGGAIYIDSTDANIDSINADFVGNNVFNAQGTQKLSEGGAIYLNGGKIDVISGTFLGNYASNYTSSYEGAGAGAIYNGGSINNISGIFISNYVSSDNGVAGGAILNNNKGTINNISGIFISNYAYSLDSRAMGGAIYNDAYIQNAYIQKIAGNFIANYTFSRQTSSGGAIANLAIIDSINASFIGNSATSNFAAFGGAVYNVNTIGDITGNFIGNSVYTAPVSTLPPFRAFGGAIYNEGTIGNKDESGNLVGGIINSSFINNFARVDNYTANGGAIYTKADLNIIADNGYSVFSGNYVYDKNGRRPEAIYVSSKSNTLKLESKNNGIIHFDDQINGAQGYSLTLTGDSSGLIELNNNVINANVTSEEVKLNLGKKDVFENSDFTITSGTLGFVNGIAEQQIMQSSNITGNINLALDVDLATEQMDTLPDNTKVDPGAQINVNYLNILNDANQNETKIPFAPDTYASQVTYSSSTPVAYSPIWKYDVDYLKETGEFLFTRGSTGTYTDYNPAVTAPSVATQAGAYTTQLQTFNYAFQHSDNFMLLPSFDRLTIKNQSKYALAPNNGVYSPLMTPADSASFWVKPYASFENIPLKNGPKVSNINYGTLIGYDSAMKPVKYGFDRVLTGYVGYNGSSQRFQGVDAYQNGGLIGTTATFYKNNFFNATTLSVGASAGDSTTMYGSENYAMLMAGIGNKTGYNFEFKDGKYILQPAMLLSYSFINTFDYRNAAGLKIESDPLHAIQLSPGLKLIMNAKNGWQPYLAIDMTWNILDKSRVTANDVRLPEMSIKPYVSYGAGVQRRFKDDKYTAFGQTMVHSGGRNGVSLTFGLRWRVGKE